jgi:uncharacterized protein YcbX
VKSCAGTALAKAKIGPRGIEHDREFMLVLAEHSFVTLADSDRPDAQDWPTLAGGCRAR